MKLNIASDRGLFVIMAQRRDASQMTNGRF
jgi:hypothetical protein